MDIPNTIQSDVIQQILSKNFMISMASQGGKSLCYQTLALQKDGITIVFVPSLALINDLLAYFATRGIEAVSINSSNRSEWDSVAIKMLMGSPKFFLWTPEMVNTNDLLRRLIGFLIENRKINYVVVDEAHYIDAMNNVTNHNPDINLRARREKHFGIIKSFREFSQQVTWIALTTASKEYKDELSEKLGMTYVHFISSHVTRKNIFYRVYDSETSSVDLAKSILEKYKNASGIIFCNSVKLIENVQNKLNRNGIRAIKYYGGQPQSNIEDWAAGKYQVIVAIGESFGFGLNHFIPTSIRFVIHRNVPGNLHAYYHESGRVGNDGAKSFAYIIKAGQINDEVSRYFEPVCRHQTLASFFGETTYPCGNMCDVCAPNDFH